MCTLIRYMGFMVVLGFFKYLVGYFSMIVWAPAVLSVLYACICNFCICNSLAQLSMFYMERCSRNTIISIIIMSPSQAILTPGQLVPALTV